MNDLTTTEETELQPSHPDLIAKFARDAICEAMLAVEKSGAHPLLTDAVVALETALSKMVAYIKLCPTCHGHLSIRATNPSRAKAWTVPCPDCTDRRESVALRSAASE